MDDDQLRFGLNPPEGVQTAWAAPWIISPAGDVDPVWDRTDAIGPHHRRRELLDHLAARVGETPHRAPTSIRATPAGLGTKPPTSKTACCSRLS